LGRIDNLTFQGYDEVAPLGYAQGDRRGGSMDNPGDDLPLFSYTAQQEEARREAQPGLRPDTSLSAAIQAGRGAGGTREIHPYR